MVPSITGRPKSHKEENRPEEVGDDKITVDQTKGKKNGDTEQEQDEKGDKRDLAKEGPSALKGMPELVHFNGDKGSVKDKCEVPIPDADSVDYSQLGYLPVEGVSKEYGKLTWTEAIRTEKTGPEYGVYKDYYLGTDPNVNFDKMHGCALFFSDVNLANAHYGPKDNKKDDDRKGDEENEEKDDEKEDEKDDEKNDHKDDKQDDEKDDNGSCEAALSKECANAMIERAKKIPTTINYCYNLLVEFEKELDAACEDFAKKDKYNGKWGSLQVKSESTTPALNFGRKLTRHTALFNNSTATLPYPQVKDTGSKLETDPCWPVAEKKSNVTLAMRTKFIVSALQDKASKLRAVLVTDMKLKGKNDDGNDNKQVESTYGVVPILTYLFTENENAAGVAKPEAHLTCLKPVDREPEDAKEEPKKEEPKATKPSDSSKTPNPTNNVNKPSDGPKGRPNAGTRGFSLPSLKYVVSTLALTVAMAQLL